MCVIFTVHSRIVSKRFDSSFSLPRRLKLHPHVLSTSFQLFFSHIQKCFRKAKLLVYKIDVFCTNYVSRVRYALFRKITFSLFWRLTECRNRFQGLVILPPSSPRYFLVTILCYWVIPRAIQSSWLWQMTEWKKLFVYGSTIVENRPSIRIRR